METMNKLMMEFRQLKTSEHTEEYKLNRADYLVWDMARVAHKMMGEGFFEMCQEYPELIPFVQFLVENYPALGDN